MKNFAKFLGIIALVAVIGFSMAACGGEEDDNGGNPDGGGGDNWSKLAYNQNTGFWVKEGTNLYLWFRYQSQMEERQVITNSIKSDRIVVDVHPNPQNSALAADGIKIGYSTTGTLAFPTATTMTISGIPSGESSFLNGTYTKNPVTINPWQLLTAGIGTWKLDSGTTTLRFYEEAGVKKFDFGLSPRTLPNNPAFDSLTTSSSSGNGTEPNVSSSSSSYSTSIVFISATQMRLYAPGSTPGTLPELPAGDYTRQEE